MNYVNLILGFGIGIILVVCLVAVACYVIGSLAYMKALKFMGYDKPWMAWIPYACYYALADCGAEGDPKLLPGMKVPVIVYKLWWIVPLVLAFVHVPYVGWLIRLAVQIICLGYSFRQIYLRMGDNPEDKAISYLSGWLPIIAVFRFLTLKDN